MLNEDEFEPDPAVVLAKLRASLDAFVGGKNKIDLTRPNLIALIGALVEGLRPATESIARVMDDGSPDFTDHPAVAMLNDAIWMLGDLNRGKVHDALKPTHGKANHALSTAELFERDVLLVTVETWQQAFKLKTRREAEKLFAAELKRQGKPITAQMLKSWRDRRDAHE